MKTYRIGIYIFLGLFTNGVFSNASAQEIQITGSMVDSQVKSTVPGVSIILTNTTDSTKKEYTITDNNGNFTISVPAFHTYKLSATSLGYQKLQKTIAVTNAPVNLGQLLMVPGTETLKEITIEGHTPQAIQKGDTTELNANAFKVNPDASAEDLVKKMPTITSDNSGVKAQGETVQQVLVDGKPFFGDDPTAALRNLPADVIDKIQVFNKLSDQAQLTGFDDGNTTKTLNIITRKNKREGKFGKFYAGYGTNNEYQAGANINFFNGDRRISILGMSNNINQQNFSSQDLIGISSSGGRGGGGRGFGGFGGGGGSSFLVGQQNGVSTTNSFGINYSDTWAEKIKVTGSYFFNNGRNNLDQLTNQQYVDTSRYKYYKELDNSSTNNTNNRINFRFEYNIDSMNSIIMVPKASFQTTSSPTNSSGQYLKSDGSILTPPSISNTYSNGIGYNLSNDLTYRHKFEKRGRTISLYINTSDSRKETKTSLYTQKSFMNKDSIITDPTNQWTDAPVQGYSISSNLMYTEPVGKIGLLVFNYGYSYSRNIADKMTYKMLHVEPGEIGPLDTLLSDKYDNDYITNRAGIGYRLRGTNYFGTLQLNYQRAELSGINYFPTPGTIDRIFPSFLPFAMFNFKLSDKNNIRLIYRTSTNAPNISQLQNVIDNSNPLILSTGNPGLVQEYSNNFLTRISIANPDKSTNFFGFLSANYTLKPISSQTISDNTDVMKIKGITLTPGTKLTMPVNLNHKWSANALLTYGFPLYFVKSNMNINTGFNFTSTPGQVNDQINIANSWTLSQGLVFSSNISEKVDFTLSYTGNYSEAKNTTEPGLNNNYFSQTGEFKLNWLFWKGIVIQSDLINQLYRGLSSSNYNQDYYLWNVGLAKKLFTNQQGEIKFNVFDLLNQNKSISRTVTGTYIDDSSVNTLKRYFMLTFTYNLKMFKGMPQMDNKDEDQHNNIPGGRRGGGGGGGFFPN